MLHAVVDLESLYSVFPIEATMKLRRMARAICSAGGVSAPYHAWPSPHICMAYLMDMMPPR
jgi:hypothetical protein